MNPVSKEQFQDLADLIEKHNMSKYKELILKLAQNTIEIKTTVQEDYKTLGNSRIGGWPDLPEGLEWPVSEKGMEGTVGKKLNFLAQINLKESKNFDINNILPSEGILYFFIADDETVDFLEPKVLYAEEINLKSTLNLYPDSDFGYMYNEYLKDIKSFKLNFSSKVSLPGYGWRDLLGSTFNYDEWDQYFELLDELSLNKEQREIKKLSPKEKLEYHWKQIGKKGFTDKDLDNKIKEIEEKRRGIANLDFITDRLVFGSSERSYMLGYPTDINSDLIPEIAKEYYSKEITDESILKKFIMIFSLDSHMDVGYNWWDAGRIEFFIHLDDLKSKNFSKIGARLVTS